MFRTDKKRIKQVKTSVIVYASPPSCVFAILCVLNKKSCKKGNEGVGGGRGEGSVRTNSFLRLVLP